MDRYVRNGLLVSAALAVLHIGDAIAQEPAARAAEQSVTSIVRETMLGAIAVGAVILAIASVRWLKGVQDQRISDKDAQAERLEQANEKDRAVQAEVAKAVNGLAEAQREQTRALERNTKAVEDHTRALDTVVREAVAARRSGTSGGYPATRPRDPRREDG